MIIKKVDVALAMTWTIRVVDGRVDIIEETLTGSTVRSLTRDIAHAVGLALLAAEKAAAAPVRGAR
jgi:hypothetical protein